MTVTTLQGHVQDHQGEKKIGRTVQVEEDTAAMTAILQQVQEVRPRS